MKKDEILSEIVEILQVLGIQNSDSFYTNKVEEEAGNYGRIEPISDFQLLLIAEGGVDTLVAEKISKNFGFSQREVSDMLHMSDRSYRNHLKERRPFLGMEAEILIVFLNLMIEGINTFDDLEDFRTWMGLRLEALNYKRPVDFLATVSGTKYITEFLKTIQVSAFA